MIENALALRQRLAADYHRPRYHFQPPSNWMNDPNGVIQWKGTYHLFYQHNPNGPLWGDIHWGHASSDDLIHWTDLPLALAPTPGGPDETGCFSGCAVDNGVPTLIYTGTRGEGHDLQTQCLAIGSDDMLTFEKYAGNPVLSQLPAETVQKRDFRDPYVWKEADAWYMVIGSRIQDVGGAVFLYRSQNLIDWEYLHPLLIDDRKTGSGIWECPNFFRLGDEWVLIISDHSGKATGTVLYFVGTFENLHFTPHYNGVLDYGTLYAPLSFRDNRDRRVSYGWLREARSEAAQRKAGWSGAQSIPRVLTLDGQHRLHSAPAPELESIRGRQHHYGPGEITQDAALDVTGLALDIVAEFRPGADGRCGIALYGSANAQERAEIVYAAASQHLLVREVSVETNGALVTHEREIPHLLDPGEALKLRILVDGSVVELIANERTSLVSRIYPRQQEHNHVWLLGSKSQLQSLDIWEMPSIW